MPRKQLEEDSKRARISQTVVPRISLEDALAVPKVIFEQFGGDNTDPLSVAQGVGQSPQSSAWRYITGAAEAYGLTVGGYNAQGIGLTDLGRSAMAAVDNEEDPTPYYRTATTRPAALRKFFAKYDGKPFPREDIARHVLVSECGVPPDRAEEALRIVTTNARFAALLVEIKGKSYIKLNGALRVETRSDVDGALVATEATDQIEDSPPSPPPITSIEKSPPSGRPTESLPTNARVFISHGKKRDLIEQIKEIVRFGKLEPVVSVEKESPSIPVPDKVLDDMRSCFAGVIHVGSDERIVGEDGKPRHKINDNVLIEIGAAMALYRRNFILLVEDGLELPSNLQGLYQCRYTGSSLDGAATMKLLRAFNEFDVAAP